MNAPLLEPESGSGGDKNRTEQVFVRSQSVVSRVIGGETLIVPVRGKVGDLASIYSLNQVASSIWRSLEVPKTLTELATAVEREYQVECERARKDVDQFLNDMLSAGLAEMRSAAAIVYE
ncbi:MAG TPA: PqqD family protein [Candidatus Aquilonibacter sp.]|nr:PqqD family protein [Candidatus Aquilonibacter sp.]